jgi:integrase
MSVNIRPYVVATNHVEGCTRRRCGPQCKRVTEGWEVDIVLTLPDGEVYRERKKSPLPSKSGSRFWGEQRANELLKQETAKKVEPEKKVVPTFAEFEPRFIAYSKTNNKPSTVYGKENILKLHLRPYFGEKRLDEIGPAEVEAYKAKKLEEGCAKKYVNNQLTVLRKLLNLAVEWGELSHTSRVRALRLPEHEFLFLDFTEARRFLDAAPPEWKTLLTLALRAGPRLGELLALKWEDLDLVSGNMVIRRSLWRDKEDSPKGGRKREVPLSDDALNALKAHRGVSMMKGEYVFCDSAGKRLSHKKLSKLVPRVCKKAGLAKRLTMHDLRHTFASHLVMRGVTLKAVQELLGHKTLDMTLRYAHLSPDVKRDAVKLLDLQSAPELGDILETEA